MSESKVTITMYIVIEPNTDSNPSPYYLVAIPGQESKGHKYCEYQNAKFNADVENGVVYDGDDD